MAKPARRQAVAPATRFDRMLQSITDLARSGPATALLEALAEVDRTVAGERERLGGDPSAAERLGAMQSRIAEVTHDLETEQQRIVRDLLALQAEAQARARYTPSLPVAGTLDRQG